MSAASINGYGLRAMSAASGMVYLAPGPRSPVLTRGGSPRSSSRPAYSAAIQPLTTTSSLTPRANGILLESKRNAVNQSVPKISIHPAYTNTQNGHITHVPRSAVTTNSLGLYGAGNTPPPYAAMMDTHTINNTPSTPAATGHANNDGSYILRTPVPAYKVPSTDLNQSLESLASEYTQRLGQSTPTMFPNFAAAEWFPSEYASTENTTEPASSVCPASPPSSTATQTLVDTFAFPTMYAPDSGFDPSAFFDPQSASSSTAPACIFTDADLAFLTGFGYPAADLPSAPTTVSVELPQMMPFEDIVGKGKAREQTPVAPPAPRKLAPAPVAGLKRAASEMDGAEEEDDRPVNSTRVMSKREQNRLAAQRSRAKKLEERETLESEVNELKEKIRLLETELQTKNAENRVLREYMGRK
ncbi:hypothetical protein CALCODRAFT_492199 [Calocera cornea HHB12733]|uniref:BZIP domain-containing protein n=1 Tax=Calocera cornea HHB12733 TaxID=1353952 RepID=A0A165IJH9_9BASI|nr:hypothetical protein CALCODRAFT_492199 [Calocera cornea HHB12733]